MAERFKAHAWKACWVKALGGSNPPPSAIKSLFLLIYLRYPGMPPGTPEFRGAPRVDTPNCEPENALVSRISDGLARLSLPPVQRFALVFGGMRLS